MILLRYKSFFYVRRQTGAVFTGPFKTMVLLLLCIVSVHSEARTIDSLINIYADRSVKEVAAEAYSLLQQHKFEESLALNKIAQSKDEASKEGANSRRYVIVLNNIACLYLYHDKNVNPEFAYPYLLKARDVATENGYTDLLAGIYDNIAKIHRDFGDKEKAFNTYLKAFEYVENDTTVGGPYFQVMVYNDIVSFCFSNDQTSRLKEINDRFRTMKVENVEMGKYSVKLNEAISLMLNKRYNEAADVLDSARDLIDSSVDSTRYLTEHYFIISEFYFKDRNFTKAEELMIKARNTAVQNHHDDYLPSIYRGLSKIYSSQGRSGEADAMRLRSLILNDSLNTAQTYARLESMEASMRIESLSQTLQASELEKRHKTNIIWVLIVFSTAIIIILIILYRKNNRLRESYQKLGARHRESMLVSEAGRRQRKEYEDRIRALEEELAKNEGDGVSSQISLPVDHSERLRILGCVSDIIENSSTVCNPDFSLEQLAQMADIKPRYLSALLNEAFGRSFSQLIAEARIKKACELLGSEDLKNKLTLEAVGMQVGYRSRTHFSSVFKKITGLTPSQYIYTIR